MKSLMLFLQRILLDMEDLCGTSTALDLRTIQSRVEHEGISFLTISLPNFCKDFEKSLEEGKVAHDSFLGFERRRGLPRLFGGFLERVFDRASGLLLEDPSIEAIFAVRQMTLAFAKINLPCSDFRIKKAINGYLECEQDIRASDASIDNEIVIRYKRIGKLLWSGIFQSIDEDIFYGRTVPRHGPGATADRLSSNAKWIMPEWTQRLERWFPHWENLISNGHPDKLGWLSPVVLEPGQERPVRVITVPKTLKTPRIIAIEPACMMFIQQGILNCFERELTRADYPGQFIRWDDQKPNQALALEGSLSGDLATLDLSEASDRVSNQHVRALLEDFPHLAGAVDSCRSRKADVFGKTIRLAKFASMGSALCFPFESIVFLTIIFLGIEEQLSRPLSKKDLNSFLGKVRVYGDDIIVPVHYATSVIRMLETFGFRVNRNKSFWTGKFRESCGKEYYGGVDVSITRVRSLLPTSRRDAGAILSTVSTRNQFYRAGCWRTAAFLDEVLGSVLTHYPIVGSRSPILGRFSFLGLDPDSLKLDTNLHFPIVRGYVEDSRPPFDRLDGYGALLKCLTQLTLREPGVLPDTSEHLERSGRPSARRIKLRWGPAL